MPRIDHINDDKTDEKLNPADTSSNLNDIEKKTGSQGLGEDTRDSDSLQPKDGSAEKAIDNKEKQPEKSLYEPSKNLLSSKQKKRGKMSLKKKSIIGIGAGGIGGLVIAGFMSLLPLKLESMIQTLTDKFGAVPEYAINQRLEYLTTRWIAMRVMQHAYPGDANLVFCRGGGILCSLGSTRYSAWFQDKLDLKLQSEGKKIKVTLNANNRAGLGGNATSFTASLESIDPKSPNAINSVAAGVKKEMGHGEARKYIKNMTKKVHGRNYLLRYISKRVLMRKYGIKRFNVVPDKLARSISELKARMKSSIIRNTLGRISVRSTAYLACLSGGSANGCAKTLRDLTSTIDSDIDNARRSVEASEDGSDARKKAEGDLKKAEGRKKTLDTAKSVISGDADGALSKIISKEIIKKVAGPVAVAGMLDMVFKVVGAIDGGIMEIVGMDRMTQAYISYAFNEEASPIVINDQMKAGQVSMDQLEIATGMMDGAESSFLYQASSGMLNGTGPIQTTCDSVDGEKKTTLPQGELVCPEMKVVQDYAPMKNEWWWRGIASVAEFWNTSFGVVFDVVGDAIGSIVGPLMDAVKHLPGVDSITKQFEKLVEYLFGLIFKIPDLGIDAPGKNNYEAMAAALQITNNSNMEGGQDPGGISNPPLGAGGAKLDEKSISMISNYIKDEEKEYFDSQTMFAKIFDPSLELSVANKLLAIMPTSTMSLLSFVSRAPSTILSTITPKLSAASDSDSMIMNAFGVPIYGYVDDNVLSQDPSIYTQEYCEISAKQREDSYGRDTSIGELVPTYKVTDPCALDKIIGGMMATEVGDTESSNYIKEEGAGLVMSSGSVDGGSGDVVGDIGWPVDKKLYDSNKSLFSKPHTVGGGSFTGNVQSIDIGLPEGTPVYAMLGGRVIKRPLGRGSYICAGTPNVNNNGGLMIESQYQGKPVKIAYAHGGNVTTKDTVETGEQIMTVGNVGNSCGPHLHMDFSYGGEGICLQQMFPIMASGQTPFLQDLQKKATIGCV